MIAGHGKSGIHDSVMDSARDSPVYRYVKEWGLALPPHIEYRTFPMLFYVPPLLPVISSREDDVTVTESDEFFHDIEKARIPIEYLANLLGAGNVGKVSYALRKQMAVRHYRRWSPLETWMARSSHGCCARRTCTRRKRPRRSTS